MIPEVYMFLKCVKCGEEFAKNWGFFTICNCPSCTCEVSTIHNRIAEYSFKISEEKKEKLIEELKYRKFINKLVR